MVPSGAPLAAIPGAHRMTPAPIPWSEWEAEAQRLHQALAQRSGPWSLTAAQAVLARLLGCVQWTDLLARRPLRS
jgi:hypothetical protein